MTEKQQKQKSNKKQVERKLKGVERFTLSYDASDNEYAEHKINAHNLVKVVQEMITLIERSDKLLNGKQKTVEIFLQAPDTGTVVKEGSLQIPFAIEVYEYISTAKNLVTTLETKDIFMALGISISSAVTYGVFKDIFRTKGEPIIDVKTQDGSNEVELLTENTKIKTSKETAILMQDDEIRRAIKNLTVAPLANKADAVFKIKREEIIEEQGEITTEEMIAVEIESGKEIETLTTLSERIVQEPEVELKSEQLITITQINFSSGESGWRMNFEEKERAVLLKDVAFIASINADKASFRKGDWLKVNLKIVKTFGTQTKTTYIITEVLEHLVSEDRKLTEN